MNHKLKHCLISSSRLMSIIKIIYVLINKNKYIKEVQRRKQLTLFDYKELSNVLPYCPSDIVIDNNLYGITYWLKRYAGISTTYNLDAYIEHGIFFGSLVRTDQKIWNVSNIITFSIIRKKHLLSNDINKRVITIGPYIHYAEPILESTTFKRLKQKLGKVLLVFPSHSIIGVDSVFDQDLFIQKIEEVKKDFDTVIVSLYWVDAQNEDIVNKYKKNNYLITTAGHRFDINFLSRLKTIIELSDFTMSNSVGTHIGYCIYLKKPHFVYEQNINNIGKNNKLQKHFDAVRNEEELCSEQIEKSEILLCFNKIINHITSEQYKIIDKYWGVGQIKSPKELMDILLK